MIFDYIKNCYLTFFSSLKIKHKLLLSYFILIMIPLCILGLVTYSRSSTVIQDQIKGSADKVLEQTEAFLSFKLDNVSRVSNLISNSAEIRNVLQRDMNGYLSTQQIDDANLLSRSLKDMEYNNNLFRIRLYVRDNLLYSNENINIFNINTIKDLNFYKDVISANGRLIWSEVYTQSYLGQADRRILTASRLIRNIKNINEIVGILSFDVLESEVVDIIGKANYTGKGLVYLVNEAGNILCTSDSQPNIPSINEAELTKLAKSDLIWQNIKIGELDVVVGSKLVEVTGWKLISIVPIDEMMAPNNKLGAQIVILMIFIGTLSYSIAYYISYSNTKRLDRMVKTMRRIQNGDLKAKVIVDSEDEIGEVQQNFNYMVDKVNQLLQERHEISQAARKAELNALQAQINPHFLYNTLDMIYWLAKRNNPQDICSAVTSLARFYKLSLSKGREIIPIKDELDHVILYVGIQNMRFENRIHLEVDVAPEVYQYYTLKLILQPLVENSILHGIMEKESKAGRLLISGRVVHNSVEIKVQDDGVGIPAEKLAFLLSPVDISQHNGYGVRNINERIKMRFGQNFGLIYESEVGKGTSVTISIPMSL